ncbi:MAG: adenine nucleotide alpha hydrolase [Winogradskyella sp.]|uniref:adenine nucleotide alpha hydrolase n=1 Tax=Winogradskyella sp. TaxID=1883156 RepID=UPI000F41ED43|nr:adenine nucleotide alpha hydrolase [Winogradskyella sp.]RNC86994.1 MAG: adenine nucleotide alpha hydrolase [Winogradskyella sp.]
MTKPYKTYFNWSSGKDSAFALYKLLNDSDYSIKELVTTINTGYNRVSMHGLRKELLIAQTDAIGLPASIIELPEQPTMAIYEDKMRDATNRLKSKGLTHAAFGDIFLEDLRAYRDKQLQNQKLKSIYPLWKEDTTSLIHRFLEIGFKAIVVCANSKYFNEDFVGTDIDEYFIKHLPKDVDPCGENGEFHTFCYDGPIFRDPIPFKIGEKVYREYKTPKSEKSSNAEGKTGFWYCDLIRS